MVLPLHTPSMLAPLHVAARHGHTKIAEFLLNKGANVNITNWHEQTPLHVAARYGHTNIVQVLLGAAADPNWPMVNQWETNDDQSSTMVSQETPLHVAVQYGHIDIVRLLQVESEGTKGGGVL